MKKVGITKDFPELMTIADAIFAHKAEFVLPDGNRVQTCIFKNTLYAVDYKGVRYVEQNPKTSSVFAQRVREEGARILWVIRTHRKIIDAADKIQYVPCADEWLGRVEGDVIFMK